VAAPAGKALEPVPLVEHHGSCSTFVVEFDFERKQERGIPFDSVEGAMAAGRFCWIDIDVEDPVAAREVVSRLGLVRDEILDAALHHEPGTQLGRYDDYLHLVVSGCRLSGHHFDLERIDAVMGEHFLLTLHKGQTVVLDTVKKSYKADFYRFARSPSFLVYELWDHLLDNYLAVQKDFEERVAELQRALMKDVDDAVFTRISDLGADLLHFRKVLLPARGVLTELSTRKSLFISEATQPFLANMLGTLERVLGDLLVDRDILSESLNLYMSYVGHRTNRVMNKLTVVSIIFLPLTFLCGVYGMNFDKLPELHWEHGYLLFWVTVGTIAGSLLWIMRKNRLL
jgi:magnesium transporter